MRASVIHAWVLRTPEACE